MIVLIHVVKRSSLRLRADFDANLLGTFQVIVRKKQTTYFSGPLCTYSLSITVSSLFADSDPMSSKEFTRQNCNIIVIRGLLTLFLYILILLHFVYYIGETCISIVKWIVVQISNMRKASVFVFSFHSFAWSPLSGHQATVKTRPFGYVFYWGCGA